MTKRNTSLLAGLLAIQFAALPLAALAANHEQHGGHGAMHTAEKSMQLSEGTIKKVDKNKSRLTIAHGPLHSLGMPPMTMAFKVGDAAMLDQVKVGDKVRFLAEELGGAYTVTTLELAR